MAQSGMAQRSANYENYSQKNYSSEMKKGKTKVFRQITVEGIHHPNNVLQNMVQGYHAAKIGL